MVSNKLIESCKTPSLKNTIKDSAIAFGILLLTIAIILWPFVVVWSMNTLFGLSIPFTFRTWLASFVLTLVIGSTPKVSNRSKE